LIAIGAFSETSAPSPALMKMSRLMIPMLSVTGKNRMSTWRIRGSRQSKAKARRKSIVRRAQAMSRNCTTVATSHAMA
jgi:hypothetical protein